MNNKYENFITDLIAILEDKLKEQECEMKVANAGDKDYIKGQILGYYDVITIIQQQSKVFDIEVKEIIGLEKYLALK